MLSAVLMLAGFAHGQQDWEIKLGPTIPVAVQVIKAAWHQDGQTLMYERKGEKGIELGIYCLGQFEGKVVLSPLPDETYEWHWLWGAKSALVVLTKQNKEAKSPTKQIRIFLVEGETQSARQIFNEVMDAKMVESVGVNASPILKHAIVSFYGEEDSKSYVLCTGRSDLVAVPEIDRAEKKGVLPSWSIDGTAVFSEVVSRKKYDLDDDNAINSAAAFDEVRSRVRISGLIFITTTRPTPEIGSNVIELMPTNAALRPVRFRGSFAWADTSISSIAAKNKGIVLQFDQSNAQESSVWLKRENEKGTSATFLAVHSSETWLAQKENSVAYLIDGALFARPILKN